jgi:hypothetical protein
MATLKTNVWTYRENLRHDPTTDYIGYDVEATDGHIGKIDEASKEASRHYVVVDTGFWIFGKKRMIPAGVIDRVDHDDHRVWVSMTKDQIKNAPDYDSTHDYRDNEYDRFGTYYSDYGW